MYEVVSNDNDLINIYKQIDKLSVEIVNDFIDKIYIGHFDEETKERKIHIVWNFAS